MKMAKRVCTASSCCNWARKISIQDSSRSFSTSLPTLKSAEPIPKFTPTSSPELDAILSNLRQRVFLPSRLSISQRRMVYSSREKQKLLSEQPVYAMVAGERFQLEPLDITKDIPSVKKAVGQAYKLMKEKRDFDNLPSIFKGTSIKHPIDTYLKEKIIRAAVQQGHINSIFECIRQKTFSNEEYGAIASRLIWDLQYQALVDGWEAAYTAKALESAERALSMLYDEHYRPKSPAVDPRSRPEVIGQLLELAAVRASKHLGGKDVDGKVAMYAKSLLATLENGIGQYRRDDHFLKEFAPVVYGIKVANTVLGPKSDVAKQLNQKAIAIEKELHEKAAKIQAEESNKNYLGMVVYNQLIKS